MKLVSRILYFPETGGQNRACPVNSRQRAEMAAANTYGTSTRTAPRQKGSEEMFRFLLFEMNWMLHGN